MNKLPIALLVVLAGCGGAQSAGPAPATGPAPAFGSLEAAIAGGHRSEANRARDRYRHPQETLTVFQIEPGQRVIELWPGGGWYTELLAPLLHDSGHLTEIVPSGRFVDSYRRFLAARPDVYDRVEVREINPTEGAVSFGDDGSADAVLTFRNFHNWMSSNYEDAIVSAAFRVLRPGGVFGVEEHRADADADRDTMVQSGYVTVQTIVDAATRAGFVLEEQSEVNANPNDDHHHPNGVWSLPPVLRGGDVDRDRFLQIGESDRMTLRFRKPPA